MIVELMACNAAFAVIRETINNGGEIMNAGQALFDYFDNKSALAKRANEKSGSSNRSDLEEFMALEQLKKQELELREMMQWQGRAGMWDDWLKFQSQAKRKREDEEREKVLKRQRMIDRIKDIGMIILVIVLLGGLGIIVGAAIWFARDV